VQVVLLLSTVESLTHTCLVSQYVDCLYFPTLNDAEARVKLRARLLRFEADVLGPVLNKLPPAFVCDVVVPPAAGDIRIIELNP
jgi:hypothetical protein